MERDQEILETMRGIVDPDLGKDIVTLGFIKDLHHDAAGNVAFTVELTTPACPVKEQFKTLCEEAVARLPWVKSVTVLMSAQSRRGPAAAPLSARAPGLQKSRVDPRRIELQGRRGQIHRRREPRVHAGEHGCEGRNF